MDPVVHNPGRTGGGAWRAALRLAKHAGLVAALGGLAALVAMGRFGPVPEDLDGWRQLRGAMRAVFLPCVLGGLVLTVAAGLGLWLRAPRAFIRARWFRVKIVALAVGLPALHFWARGRVIAFYEAIDAGEPAHLADHLAGVTRAYAVALAFVTAAALFARAKPRLGSARD